VISIHASISGGSQVRGSGGGGVAKKINVAYSNLYQKNLHDATVHTIVVVG
jgi:hypothetical protein